MITERVPISSAPRVIHQYSRYNGHPVYLDEETGVRFLGTWQRPSFPISAEDTPFTISGRYAFRADLISYRFYHTVLLSWVLCAANDVGDPWDREDGFIPGRLIRIPNLNLVMRTING